MTGKRAIVNETDGLLDLKALVDAYEEIAANQMQRVRSSVLQSREFMEGVTKIFTKVRRSYEKQIAQLEKSGKKKIDEFSVLPRNGKTVAVFVSANSGLFGDIVERTFSIFMDFLHASEANSGTKPDVVIIGKLGLRMLNDRGFNILYNYFDFPDDTVDFDAITVMMRYLLQYERILVFHGQFRSLVNQEPVSTGVSGHELVLSQTPEAAAQEEKLAYLFEPSLKDVLQVFEGEILSSIFAQSLHESQLAKFAARMFNLDRAMENIENRMKDLSLLRRRVEHEIAARKQLGRIAGMTLWQ